MSVLPVSRIEFWTDQRGGVLPLVGLCMLVILGLAALMIDFGQQRALSAQLEATADAAALAAATQLPDQRKARKKALEYAEKNMPAELHGTVLAEADILFGSWYEERREFDADGPVANAVQVTLRRSERNGNAAPTFFLRLFGRDHADLSADALAGSVLFENTRDDGTDELSEADREKMAEMQTALREEFDRQWRLSPGRMDSLMTDIDAVAFLLENYGRAVLLK